MKRYSEIIKSLREDNDLNQTDIANIIGTTQQQYSKYENENAEISVKALIELAEFYDVSTDFLLGRVEYSANIKKLEKFLISDKEISKMLSNLQFLSSSSKKSVFEYVELQLLKENQAKNK